MNPVDSEQENGCAREKSQNGFSTSADLCNGNSKMMANVKKTRSFMELSMRSATSVKSLGRNERRVLVLYTGGTIGMVKNRDGGKRKN
jgi:L-asparaginase/Glu-tRNA(Gln) amidotransferase subunit D